VSLDVLLAGAIVALRTLVRRWRAAPGPPIEVAADGPSPLGTVPSPVTAGSAPGGDARLDSGLRDIRRTDPGFDPSRFVGYAAMTFRDVQRASATGQIAALRDRVTPEMYGRLQAQGDRPRPAAEPRHVEHTEAVAEIREAWQESGHDYVKALIRGPLIEESWTFTRPAGLNFWMLSAIERPGRRMDEGLA
jgi:predicted lipid-binding transport protein (Tim44 family)